LENDRIIEEYENEESKGEGSEPNQTIPDSKDASKVIDEFIEEEKTTQLTQMKEGMSGEDFQKMIWNVKA